MNIKCRHLVSKMKKFIIFKFKMTSFDKNTKSKNKSTKRNEHICSFPHCLKRVFKSNMCSSHIEFRESTKKDANDERKKTMEYKKEKEREKKKAAASAFANSDPSERWKVPACDRKPKKPKPEKIPKPEKKPFEGKVPYSKPKLNLSEENLALFAIIGIEPIIDKRIIRITYMRKAIKMHPDKIINHTEEDEENFRILKDAYEDLLKLCDRY